MIEAAVTGGVTRMVDPGTLPRCHGFGAAEGWETMQRNSSLEATLAEAKQDYTSRNPASLAHHKAAGAALPGGNTRTLVELIRLRQCGRIYLAAAGRLRRASPAARGRTRTP